MRDVTVTAVVRADRDAVYERLADFPRYKELARSVRSVEMSADRARSTWEVSFRDGVLKWTEEDRYDPVARRIDFSQVEGDMERFDGWWTVTDTEDGSLITFYSVFDLGLPGLAEFLEPVAHRALQENIRDLVEGLFGGEVLAIDENAQPPADSLASGFAGVLEGER